MNRSEAASRRLRRSPCPFSSCQQTGADTEQAAQAPGTELGIVPASMDRSVKPGDDFFTLRQRQLGQEHADPRGPVEHRRLLHRRPDAREADARAARRPAQVERGRGQNEGKIANYYNAYLNTDAIDKAGLNPAKADLDAIGRIADKTQLSAAIGGTLRADTDPLNATNFQTENLFGIFVTQGLNTPGETLPYLMQGGIGLPEREYYLGGDAKMADLRNKYRDYIATIMRLAGNPRSAGRRWPDPGPRNEDRPRPCHARGERGLRQGRDGLDPRRAGAEGAGHRLGRAAECGAARRRAEVPGLSRGRDPEAGRAGRFGAAGCVEGLAGVPHAQPAGERPAQAVPRRELRLQRHRSDRSAQGAAARPIGDERGRQCPAGCGRQGLHRQILPGLGQGRSPEDGRGDQGRLRAPGRSARLDGAVDQGRSAEEGPRSIVVGVGYPDTWRDYSGLEIGNDAYANQKNAEPRSNIATRSRRSASRWTATNGGCRRSW